MIAQNSEVYNPPTYLFSLYTYMEKISVGGLYTSLFCAIIPALFPYFLPFWYPYILLHFQMFFITCSISVDESYGIHHSFNLYLWVMNSYAFVNFKDSLLLKVLDIGRQSAVHPPLHHVHWTDPLTWYFRLSVSISEVGSLPIAPESMV